MNNFNEFLNDFILILSAQGFLFITKQLIFYNNFYPILSFIIALLAYHYGKVFIRKFNKR